MPTLHAPQRISASPAALQHPDLTGRTVRPTLLDRLTLRVAVALLLRSTRPQPTRDDSAARRRDLAARAHRERHAERRRALLLIIR